jgi:hypothetical protein
MGNTVASNQLNVVKGLIPTNQLSVLEEVDNLDRLIGNPSQDLFWSETVAVVLSSTQDENLLRFTKF